MLAVKKRIAEISYDEQEKARTVELLKYQIKDIDSVNPREGEEDELKRKRTKVQNAEKIGKHAKLIYRALYQNEKGASACDLLEKAEESLSALEGVLREATSFAETLTDFRYRLEDIAETIRGECDMGIKNPSELLDKIEERLDNLQRLRKKYGGTVEEIKKYRERIVAKLNDLEMSGELSEDLENELSEIRAKMKTIAASITAKRRAAAEYLSGKKNDGIDISIITDGKIRYTVPQRISAKKDVTVYFRVSDVYRNVRIVVKDGDKILVSKKKQKVAPGEMETVTLKAEHLANVGKKLSFSLEFDERTVK